MCEQCRPTAGSASHVKGCAAVICGFTGIPLAARPRGGQLPQAKSQESCPPPQGQRPAALCPRHHPYLRSHTTDHPAEHLGHFPGQEDRTWGRGRKGRRSRSRNKGRRPFLIPALRSASKAAGRACAGNTRPHKHTAGNQPPDKCLPRVCTHRSGPGALGPL